jgi:hypothetical protein
VKPTGGPPFEPSLWAMGEKVRAAQERLKREFDEASAFYRFEPSGRNVARISTAPWAVMDFTLRQRFCAGPPSNPKNKTSKSEEATQQSIPAPAGLAPSWEKEAATALFAFQTGRDSETRWEQLSKSDRRKAQNLWKWLSAPDRIRQKGASIKSDVPLLLYLIFIIEEFTRTTSPRSKFPRSRPTDSESSKRPPGGPAFRLLSAAYAHALCKLHVPPSLGAETIVAVIGVARRDRFRQRIMTGFPLRNQFHWGGSDRADAIVEKAAYTSPAEVVTEHPGGCALQYADAVQPRRKLARAKQKAAKKNA